MKPVRQIIFFLMVLFQVATGASGIQQVEINYDHIDAFVQKQMKRSLIPGLSYAIVDHGEIVHIGAFGVTARDNKPMTDQTLLYMGSVSKTFTALAVRQLVNSGLIGLDEPVRTYLPDFKLADEQAASQITIKQLLTHTSGFSEQAGNDPVFFSSGKTNEEMVAVLADFELDRPVGLGFEYSNINYIILGRVIEKVSGLTYGEYLDEKIFAPLGMQSSTTDEETARRFGMSEGYRYYFGLPVIVDPDEPAGAVAAGFSISSAEDMAHYLIAFTQHGWYKDISIIDTDGQQHPEDLEFTYNIYWLTQEEMIRPSNTESHSGAWLNYSAGILFIPESEVGVVALANSTPAQWLPVKDTFGIALDVLRIYTGNEASPDKVKLSTVYMIVDIVILALASVVIARVFTLRQWHQNFCEGRQQNGFWLFIVVDLAVPMVVLLVLPVLILAGSGQVNPIWCWNRLLLQVPDVSAAILVISIGLLVTGSIKTIWLILGRLRSEDEKG